MSSFSTQTLLDIFPPALRKSPDYWALAQVIAPELNAAFQAVKMAEVLCRVDELPEYILDALAYDLDVFWWNPNASLSDKRLGIKQALASHRRLGTTQSVQDAINTFLGGGVVDEWFNFSGDPFHFQIALPDTDIITGDLSTFLRVLDGAKRASAIMDGFVDFYLTDENDNHLLSSDDSPLTT